MEQPYSNREIMGMFKSHEVLDTERFGDLSKNLFDPEQGYLPRIEAQTVKTNGHVAALKRWQDMTVGALAVLTIVIVPILGWALYTLVNIPQVVHQSVDEALSAYEVNP